VPSITSSPTSTSHPSIYPTSLPSSIPTSSSAPTITPDCSCDVGEFKFELELKTDIFPGETSWRIEDENGDILASESGYNDTRTIFNHEYCLPAGYHVFLFGGSDGFRGFVDDDFDDDDDDFGDDDDFAVDGYYKGSIYGWKEVFNGGNFNETAIEHFFGEDLCPFATHYPSIIPTSSSPPSILPSLNPSTSPSVSSSPTLFADCSCGVGEFKFEVELRTDRRPWETSWRIEDENGDILVSESGYTERWTIFNHEYCLPVGCHDFVIDDGFAGDDDELYFQGIRGFLDDVGFGDDYDDDVDGYYKASVYGRKEIFSGGEFGFNTTKHFCGEDLCPFATHYPSTSPSTSSHPSMPPSLNPSTSPSASSHPSISLQPSINPSTNPTISSNPTKGNPQISPILDTKFYVYTTRQPWNDCKRIADNMGHSFASIRNQQENDAVVDHMNSNNIWTVWLGGYQTSFEDEPAGNWAWLDGTPWTDFTYTDWRPGQPNNWQNREHYVYLTRWDGTWYDGSKEYTMSCLFRDPK